MKLASSAVRNLWVRWQGGFALFSFFRKFLGKFRDLPLHLKEALFGLTQLSEFQVLFENGIAAHGERGQGLFAEIDEQCESPEHDDREIEGETIAKIGHELGVAEATI